MANLRLFQRGNVTPGAGRPRTRKLTEIVKQVLEEPAPPAPGRPKGETVKERLARTIIAHAAKGKFPFAKEIWDRIEGRPVEQVDVSMEVKKGAEVRERIAGRLAARTAGDGTPEDS